MERQKQKGGTDRSPLILIVILVYAAFLVTALASIMVFFPQASLPGSLRPSIARPAEPARPATPVAAPGEAPQRAPTSAIARLAAAVGSHIAALEWPEVKLPEIQWPDLAGWARHAAAAVGAWFRNLPAPDFAALWQRLRGRAEPAAAAAPTVEQAPVAAAPLVPPVQDAPRAAAAVSVPAPALAEAAPRVDELRRAYEARLREAEARYARDLAAARAEAAARYNPVFDQAEVPGAAAGVNRALFGADVSAPYRDVLGREGIASREQYEQLRSRAAELDALAGRLLRVPYANSVPPALERIRDAGQTLALEYGRIWNALADRLETRDQRIGRLEAQAEQFALAMDSLSRSTREGGYILDPRDSQSILLYVSRLHSPSVGDTVYVFRREDELLATLRITSVGDTVRAALVEKGPAGRPIAAFDRILLAAAEEKRG